MVLINIIIFVYYGICIVFENIPWYYLCKCNTLVFTLLGKAIVVLNLFVCKIFTKLKRGETGVHVPQGPSLRCEPDQSAYSKTETAAVVESGVCRVFDKAPVAVNTSTVI